MKLSEKQIAIGTQPVGAEPVWENLDTENPGIVQKLRSHLLTDSEFRNVIATFLTTLAIFGIYLVQGIIVARILLPEGRGEFGTAMFFPRDVFLYAGLFGGVEIVNTDDADSALKTGTPLLTIDVWEHAYYVDQRNKRPDYIASFYSLINWDAVAARYAAAI